MREPWELVQEMSEDYPVWHVALLGPKPGQFIMLCTGKPMGIRGTGIRYNGDNRPACSTCQNLNFGASGPSPANIPSMTDLSLWYYDAR
jgi:hypothetical protein